MVGKKIRRKYDKTLVKNEQLFKKILLLKGDFNLMEFLFDGESFGSVSENKNLLKINLNNTFPRIYK